MFYVIFGYAGPDHCANDGGVLLRLKEFDTQEAVLKFYEECMDGISKYDTQVTFRVIEGKERKVIGYEKITKHKLE